MSLADRIKCIRDIANSNLYKISEQTLEYLPLGKKQIAYFLRRKSPIGVLIIGFLCIQYLKIKEEWKRK